MICPGLSLSLALAGGAQVDTVRYAAKAGETIEAIAARAFDPACASGEVGRINHLSDTAPLAAGRTLLIPRILLRTEKAQGTLESLRGPVIVRPAGVVARPGQIIAEGAVIETGANAAVRIALPDGSRIAIPSNSRVRFDRLRRVSLTGAYDRALSLLAGRAESTVTPMTDPTGRYVISTPVAVSAVRGTVFRSSYDPVAKEGSSGVLKGAVAVSGGGREVLPHGNEGVTASPQGVSDPKPLLPPPALDHADRRQVGDAAAFDIRPNPGAVRHHVKIATDAALTQVVRESEQASPHVSLADLPDGDYVAGVSDIAPGGLEGLVTTYAFSRQQLEVASLRVREERSPGRTRYLFVWRPLKGVAAIYRFTLARAEAAGPPVIDRKDLTATETPAVGLPPGAYVWRVTATWTVAGKATELSSEPQPLTVDAPDR